MKILPEPFVQLGNIGLPSAAGQGSSLAHSVKTNGSAFTTDFMYTPNPGLYHAFLIACTNLTTFTNDSKLIYSQIVKYKHKCDYSRLVSEYGLLRPET